MARFGSPQLGHYHRHQDRPYVGPWMAQNQGLLGLGLPPGPFGSGVGISPRQLMERQERIRRRNRMGLGRFYGGIVLAAVLGSIFIKYAR